MELIQQDAQRHQKIQEKAGEIVDEVELANFEAELTSQSIFECREERTGEIPPHRARQANSAIQEAARRKTKEGRRDKAEDAKCFLLILS